MRHSNSICDICFLPIARVNGSTTLLPPGTACSIVCRATGLGRNPETDLVFERDADLSGRAHGHVTGGIRATTAMWRCMPQRSSRGIDGLIVALDRQVELLTATAA